ncbi:hypothetical protein C8A05DRAFT_37990 [Staphylotrichum tortipilum]|uniref:Uncharacterized protein n=1 Tax=Staphylotrichum tortipilum TaxID=2831512 RepID=A0AAN6RPW3_9PEZI|nr:hypothetical protein C8A05DRAFT_37990 [Staphylotrichum longicolle]
MDATDTDCPIHSDGLWPSPQVVPLLCFLSQTAKYGHALEASLGIHSGTFTGPASGVGSLIISVRQAAGLGAQQVPALFDQIFVNPVGDMSTSGPAQVSF